DTSSYDPQAIDKNLAEEQQFRILKDDLPATPDSINLASTLIPHEAVLVNHHFLEDGDAKRFNDYKSLMSKLFRERDGKNEGQADPKFQKLKTQPPDAWVNQYKGVMRWLQEAHLPREVFYRSTFEDLLRDLAAYKESPKNLERPLRLALVLSGGGAKCAYQAGAIAAIENKLKEFNQQHKGKEIDIDLVVGTSGGAINALVTALGVTKEADGQKLLRHTWQAFHQRDFFQPSLPFNVIFGIFFFGFLQMLVVTGAVLIFGRERSHWTALFLVLVGLALLETLVVVCLQYPYAALRTSMIC